ncbi:hypothetical protein O181_008679 [Austropuccinia psidii MF-1]|uniref:Uncharacterized protein n=1 Tax=Austropuccinia psidii MF-1 TaxID=1389203 RepID=A0A9Q3BPB9_9BASI|nr:hypothetical protein [Austropuccinia psidii MF-1]
MPNSEIQVISWKQSTKDEFSDCEKTEEEVELRPPEDLELEEKSQRKNGSDNLSLESLLPPAARRIKDIGPRNPTSINSNIS